METPPAFLIARKRDGKTLSRREIRDFTNGVTSMSWTDAQVGAMYVSYTQLTLPTNREV